MNEGFSGLSYWLRGNFHFLNFLTRSISIAFCRTQAGTFVLFSKSTLFKISGRSMVYAMVKSTSVSNEAATEEEILLGKRMT